MPASPSRSFLWPLQAAVALAFAAVVIAIAGGLVWYNHAQLTVLAENEARADFKSIAEGIRREVSDGLRIAETLVDTVTLTLDPDLPPDRLHPVLLGLMRQVDRVLPASFGLFVARPDGSLTEVQDLTGARPAAVAGLGGDAAALGLMIVERGTTGATERWIVTDAAGRELARTPAAATPFDPRERSWYKQAMTRDGVIVTAPYAFFNAPGAGITIARRMPDRPGVVVGLDVTLTDLDTFLARNRQQISLEPVIFDRSGRLVAHPEGARLRSAARGPGLMPAMGDLDSPLLAALARAFQASGLDQETRFTVGGEPYFARFEPAGTAMGDFVIGVAVPQSVMMGEADRIRSSLLAVGAAAIAVALLLVYVAARGLVSPLRLATHDLDRIVRLQFEGVAPVRSRLAEVDELGQAVATLRLALQNFVRYVPFSLVRRIVDRSFSPELGGRRQRICVMFSDIEGFTGLAETLDADELTHRTSRYFSEVGEELIRSNATIDKYIGDSVMAFWNAPEPQPDFVRLACLGTLRAARRVDRLNAALIQEGAAPMTTRFGLHCGEAVVGNVGTVDRMNYTAFGHTVNLASRLEGLNREFGTTILASEAVVEEAGPDLVFRPVGETVPRGSAQPVRLFALLGATLPDESELALPTLLAPPVVKAQPRAELALDASRDAAAGKGGGSA